LLPAPPDLVPARSAAPPAALRHRPAALLVVIVLAMPFAYSARAESSPQAAVRDSTVQASAVRSALSADGYDRPSSDALDGQQIDALAARSIDHVSRDFDRPAVDPLAPATSVATNAERAPVSLVRPTLASRKPKPKPKSGSQWHSDRWVRPGNGRFTSGFKFRWGRWHKGIDLAAPMGAPIVAAADGVVIYAGPASGFGRLVLIRHSSSVVTAYGHMSAYRTHVGAHVHAGELIALIGAAGDSTGPHLHFEVRINGVQVNPVPYLRKHGVYI
jgi:murein DD-endopeptidase MepM/ murein hydrolase activator NlpD